MKMPDFFLQRGNLSRILIFLFIISLSGCKKENSVQSTAYTIDSIAVDLLDTVDNNTIHYTINRNTGLPLYLSQNSTLFAAYEQQDSFLLSLKNDPAYDLPGYPFYEEKVFNNRPVSTSIFSYSGQYGQDEENRSFQTFKYINGRLSEFNILTGRYLSVGAMDAEAGWDVRNTFIYSDKLESITRVAINKNSVLDSISFSIGFAYPNQYANQAGLIGLDVNDLVFYHYTRSQSGYKTLNVRTAYYNETAYRLYGSLMLNEKYTFGFNNPLLFEKLSDNTFGTDVRISYEFDSLFSNRIRLLEIRGCGMDNSFNPVIARYKFYYKD